MNGFVPLPGLLDDPHIQSDDLPTRTDVHIAPLRNPAPLRNGNVPSPLEPLADSTHPSESTQKSKARPTADLAQKRVKRSPYVKPRDVILAKDVKKPNLAISELVENRIDNSSEAVQLPSFVNLAIVEGPSLRTTHSYGAEPSYRLPRREGDATSEGKEGYRHLPPPAHKDEQFSSRPLPLLPAMVAGLHEPPISAGILPSMELESSLKTTLEPPAKMDLKTLITNKGKKSHGRPPEMMLNSPKAASTTLPEHTSWTSEQETAPVVESVFSRKEETGKKPGRRIPRKWSEAETEHLMEGVKRHGIGKWKQILRDPAFTFYNRTTGDLKDRYRVCTGHENRDRSSRKVATMDAQLREQDAGLSGKRRRRRLWTAFEDEALMKGLAKYGFQWTAIHSDAELGLSHRRSTDIRDRVRTKFPDAYRHAATAPLRQDRVKKSHIPGPALKERDAKIGEKSTNAASPMKTGWDENDGRPQRVADSVAETVQDSAGLTLPPIVSEETAWNWDNTLPPLMDWEEIGI